MEKHSIVEFYAEHESYRCGYCGSPNTNFSHGMWAHSMTVNDYQDLIDRGWRRSGKYCYKPTMDATCCPLYTIRCSALEFKLSKSQKKVLKRFNKYLSGEELSMSTSDVDKTSTTSNEANVVEEGRGEQFVENSREHQDINVAGVFVNNEQSSSEVKENFKDDLIQMDTLKTGSVEDVTKQMEFKHGTGPDPSKAPCKKAKQLRRERKLEKLKEKGIDVSSLSTVNKNKEKQLEDFLNELPDEYKKRLELKLVRTAPPSPEWLATAKATHTVYVNYQSVIHNDKPEKNTEMKFKEFLVQSPLLEEHTETGPPCGYGSFHQQYWLDGKLIAVGVIDILPKCVSSVYFFYDPNYMNITLGTYGALKELEFTRQLHAMSPELKYYYMGYYIHSCRKMRYKGNYHPSDLLCPETYKWFPIKDCLDKIEKSPYSRLDPDLDSVDSNYPKIGDLSYIPVLVKGVVLPYKMYKRKCKKSADDDEVLKYAQLVGAKSAGRLILVR